MDVDIAEHNNLKTNGIEKQIREESKRKEIVSKAKEQLNELKDKNNKKKYILI